jgi:hypothetical protein
VVADPRVNGSGWAAKSFNSPPQVADFHLRSDSPARRKGVALGATLSFASALAAGSQVGVPCRTFDQSELKFDFRCAARPAPPNIGALEDSVLQAPALWF